MNIIYGIKKNFSSKIGKKKISDESYKWIMKAVNTEKLIK